jgi:hypothetical protein
MRLSWSVVRPIALVLAAGASGYLWRAALEPGATQTIIRLGPATNFDARGRPASVLRITAPAHPHGGAHHAHAVGAVLVSLRTPVQATGDGRASAHAPPRSPTSPRPKPTPSPAPAPSPSPTPPASAPASVPSGGPSSSPPPKPPKPAPPPLPLPISSIVDDGSRPGNGNGDDNHDHTGPPGHEGDHGNGQGHGHGGGGG